MNIFYKALAVSFGVLLPLLANAAVITNGDFETGDLSGWTSFVTSNGVTSPRVSEFSVNGLTRTYAAQFQVGEDDFTSLPEGGGISQMFNASQGVFNISAEIATLSPGEFPNGDAGAFSLILDGVVISTYNFGFINPDEILRGKLNYSGMLTEGVHELVILVTRSYQAGSSTPFQYVDNVQVQAAAEAIPEPATVALFAIGLFGVASFKRRFQR